jgi:hypothetical protein
MSARKTSKKKHLAIAITKSQKIIHLSSMDALEGRQLHGYGKVD